MRTVRTIGAVRIALITGADMVAASSHTDCKRVMNLDYQVLIFGEQRLKGLVLRLVQRIYFGLQRCQVDFSILKLLKENLSRFEMILKNGVERFTFGFGQAEDFVANSDYFISERQEIGFVAAPEVRNDCFLLVCQHVVHIVFQGDVQVH